MVGFCDTSRPLPATGRPSHRTSVTRAASNHSNILTTGEIAQPIRVGAAPSPGPSRQRFFKSVDATSTRNTAATERRKARIDKGSISAIVHHSRSVGDLNNGAAAAAAAVTASNVTVVPAAAPPTRPRKGTLSTWSSNQPAATDPQRSKGSLQQQRSNTANGLRGAIRNIFSRSGEEAPESPPLFSFEESPRLSRQTSPLDVGGVLNSLNSIESRSNSSSTTSTNSNASKPLTSHATSAPRFIPVRTVQDIPLGISFSDNIFASHPTHIRVPPHHTSYGSSPTKINASNAKNNHHPSRSQTSNVSTAVLKSATEQTTTTPKKRPSTAQGSTTVAAPSSTKKGILIRPGSSQQQQQQQQPLQSSWELYSGYGSGSSPGLGSPSHPLARRPSLRRQKRDSLDVIRTKSSGNEERAVTAREQHLKTNIPPSPPPVNTDQYKHVGQLTRSAHASSAHTAPRLAMEELSLAARLAELEARMTNVEVSFCKFKHRKDHGTFGRVPAAPASELSTGQTPSEELSSSTSSYPGHTTWLLNDSNPSSRNPSAPNTPPPNGDSSTMTWVRRDSSFLHDAGHSPVDDYDGLSPEAHALKDGIEFLRHELSLIRRYNSKEDRHDHSPYDMAACQRVDSAATVPAHALDEHVPDFERLARVRRSSSSRGTPSDQISDLSKDVNSVSLAEVPDSSAATAAAIDFAMGAASAAGEEDVEAVMEAATPLPALAISTSPKPMKLQLPSQPDYSTFAGPELQAEWSSRVADHTPIASSDGGDRSVESYMNAPPPPPPPPKVPQQHLLRHLESLRRFDSSSTMPIGASEEQHGLHELERYQRRHPAPPTSAYSAIKNNDAHGSFTSDASSGPSNIVASWDVPGMPRSRFSFDSDDEDFGFDDERDADEMSHTASLSDQDHSTGTCKTVVPSNSGGSSSSISKGLSLVKGISVLRVPSGEARRVRIMNLDRTSSEEGSGSELIERTMYDHSSSSPPSPVSPLASAPSSGAVEAVGATKDVGGQNSAAATLAAATLAAAAVAAAIAEARRQTAKRLES